jgi:hypothetical protein
MRLAKTIGSITSRDRYSTVTFKQLERQWAHDAVLIDVFDNLTSQSVINILVHSHDLKALCETLLKELP